MPRPLRDRLSRAALAALFATLAASPALAADSPQMLVLDRGWQIRSSAEAAEAGEALSSPAYAAKGWLPTRVPSTVLAALVRNGVYPDVFFGKNLENVPREPFERSWWFRTTFVPPQAPRPVAARLIFEGVNYRANVFLNGRRIAGADKMFGAFRVFSLDVTDALRTGQNALAVEVLPPRPGDLTLGFVDWTPRPPDANMGLFRPVKLALTGPVSLEHAFVTTRLAPQSHDEARLTVSATLTNHTDRPVAGTVRGKIEERVFALDYALAARERRVVSFTPDTYPTLVVRQPRLWWPHGLGAPELYSLTLTALAGDEPSDAQTIAFGIREVGDYFNASGHRGYTVNGRKVLIRGGGWMDQLFLEEDEANLGAQFRLTRHMNLNTIRLEGFWGSSQKLYDLADRHGILLMAGWSCQWEWDNYVGKEADDFGAVRSPEDMDLVIDYLRDQVLWLRHHPSILVWVLGSDKLPRPALERRYDALMADLDPARPVLKACKGLTSEVSGPTGVKMNGPYDYVTPNYWYVDTKNGGAFGFNTETGPGPQPPPLESLQKMIPADRLWGVNDVWHYHCARGEFGTLDRYVQAFDKRYGPAASAEDFAFRSQVASYEAMRAMFEAFAVNREETTGLIQWMLNAAWPKLYWQLYDYFLMPTGAFYGARKGGQPLSLVYDYGKHAVWIVNQTAAPAGDLKATISVWDLASKKTFERTMIAEIAADSSRKILDLPSRPAKTPVYFVALALRDAQGRDLATNFYWLSAKADVLDPQAATWFVTPNKGWADFTALARLPRVALALESRLETLDGEEELTATLTNPSEAIAFGVELRVVGEKTGRAVLPVFWDDNYVSLLPGERRVVRARFAKAALEGERPVLRLAGWNVEAQK